MVKCRFYFLSYCSGDRVWLRKEREEVQSQIKVLVLKLEYFAQQIYVKSIKVSQEERKRGDERKEKKRKENRGGNEKTNLIIRL